MGQWRNSGNFNSHAPCGARRYRGHCFVHGRNFNSHAPCGARQKTANSRYTARLFQLTRPLRGATLRGQTLFSDNRYFNSHAPCGARQRQSAYRQIPLHFNSHAPCGARLPRPQLRAVGNHFNSHAPCGARRACTLSLIWTILFQLTRPLRGATRGLRVL